MNKLPKEIYVDGAKDEPIYFTDPKDCAVDGGVTVEIGVYKLAGTVEVSIQLREEIVVKKSGKKLPKKTKTESIPMARNPLLQEMRVMEAAE